MKFNWTYFLFAGYDFLVPDSSKVEIQDTLTNSLEKAINNPQYFTYDSEYRFTKALKKLGSKREDLNHMMEKSGVINAIVLKKNSPWTKVISKGKLFMK